MKNPAEKAEQYAAPIADDYTADRTRSSWKQVYEDLCFAHLAGQKCALESEEVGSLVQMLKYSILHYELDNRKEIYQVLEKFEKARLK
jgi:hypothetical protein